ncbi:BRD4-interacting chromatin-remodeling complex-associated protein-like isoform X1 [Camelus ferus]|uniref:BRD4-interacting chromatin-remodeling complex-associated protein-like isoform X1 n=1 Tax=Camelus ferus TaxID=419612 RepID=A0A8B8TW43_CAMFR|nr:BRD4-interacting chromatin-remodeling complex-associated protein-like isoform X1 [Camelus ferus]
MPTPGTAQRAECELLWQPAPPRKASACEHSRGPGRNGAEVGAQDCTSRDHPQAWRRHIGSCQPPVTPSWLPRGLCIGCSLLEDTSPQGSCLAPPSNLVNVPPPQTAFPPQPGPRTVPVTEQDKRPQGPQQTPAPLFLPLPLWTVGHFALQASSKDAHGSHPSPGEPLAAGLLLCDPNPSQGAECDRLPRAPRAPSRPALPTLPEATALRARFTVDQLSPELRTNEIVQREAPKRLRTSAFGPCAAGQPPGT